MHLACLLAGHAGSTWWVGAAVGPCFPKQAHRRGQAVVEVELRPFDSTRLPAVRSATAVASPTTCEFAPARRTVQGQESAAPHQLYSPGFRSPSLPLNSTVLGVKAADNSRQRHLLVRFQSCTKDTFEPELIDNGASHLFRHPRSDVTQASL